MKLHGTSSPEHALQEARRGSDSASRGALFQARVCQCFQPKPESATTSVAFLHCVHSQARWERKAEQVRGLGEQSHSHKEAVLWLPPGLCHGTHAISISRGQEKVHDFILSEIQSNSKTDSHGDGKQLLLVQCWDSHPAPSLPRIV